VGVFFADIQNILDVLLRFWLYMSPVLYYLGDFHDKIVRYHHSIFWYHLYLLNPMTNILQCYNIIVYEARPPDWGFVVRAAVAAVITFIFGLWIFHRAEGQIGKYV
jgi:ABC-type polysaccharide/polyol phosphate export permease